MPEPCVAGIKTINEAISRDHHAFEVIKAMSSTAARVISADPEIGVRELTETLTSSDHYLSDPRLGDIQYYVWGTLSPHIGPDSTIGRTDVTTKRAALAVATCATRNCTMFEQCLVLANYHKEE